MNKIFNFFLLTVLSGFIISCQKEYNPYVVPEEEKDMINNLQGHFTCKMNGEDFSAEFQHAMFQEHEDLPFKMLTIHGIKYDDERIEHNFKSVSISVGIYEGPIWYNVMYPGASASLIISHEDYDAPIIYMSVTADETQFLQITEDNGKFIKGKFNLKVSTLGADAHTVELSEGDFHVPVVTR